MLDFCELPVDGNKFEQLIRELLFSKGYKVFWSGVGSDGGKDLLAIEQHVSILGEINKTWLIQCKHNAHAEKSVGISTLDDIIDSCTQHEADGYLLVCSTFPSSKVIERLESIKNNPKNVIDTAYWDGVTIERLLNTQNSWNIAQKFFPISANKLNISVNQTENPNYWIVNFNGYKFHLSNRIGSNCDYHFYSIKKRLSEIESIQLPRDQYIRLRAIYYDDKNGNYTWYLDYMYARDSKSILNIENIKAYLGNECVWEDGQVYNFDIISYQFFPFSDHFDIDHYDYYKPYISTFQQGNTRYPFYVKYSNRSTNYEIYEFHSIENKEKPFEKLINSFKKHKFLKVINSGNSNIEALDKFYFQHNWADIIKEYEINDDAFFSSYILVETNEKEKLFKMLKEIPLNIDHYFTVMKKFIFLPENRFNNKENSLYEIHFYISPYLIENKFKGRILMNDYLTEISTTLDKYKESN